MSHRERTRARMRALLERWRSSGQSASAFSRRYGITPQKLSYWKCALARPSQRAARPARPARTARTARSGFVPVQLVDGPAEGAGGSLEIMTDSGWRVVVRQGVSRELLADVVAALRQAC